MGYSNFLFLKEELSLIAVMLILLVYDLFGSQKSLKYFHPVACVLFLAHTLLNLFPAGTAEAFGGMYVCTPIGSIVKTILNTGTLIVLLQAYNWVNSESVLIRRGEFYLILFSSLLGMYFMISSSAWRQPLFRWPCCLHSTNTNTSRQKPGLNIFSRPLSLRDCRFTVFP